MLVSLSPRDNNHLHFGVYISSFFSVYVYVGACTKCVGVCYISCRLIKKQLNELQHSVHHATSTCRHISTSFMFVLLIHSLKEMK